jgi:hypothetical protein
LVGCGSARAVTSLVPSSAAPTVHKERTLTAGEFPAMRDWIVGDESSPESTRPICDELEAAPNTPVIRAARNACDRTLAILIDGERVGRAISTDVATNCRVGDYQCGASVLRGLRPDLVEVEQVFAAYYRDIDAAMSPGPCRAALMPPTELASAADQVTGFDNAVSEYARGHTEKLARFLNEASGSHGISDPAPCRPG